LNIMS